MDVISREAAANELEKHQYSREFCIEHHIDYAMDMGMVRITVNSLPSAFDGMTNGEVIIALFPNADYEGGAHFMHITNVNSIGEVSFPWEWWNAPYKGESEVVE